ncbi:hypothetical protein BABINDRAFT_29051, partial [Babjeviella inositovora NRRL Y-12698]
LRIYIGNISPKLVENIDNLSARIAKISTLVKPVEVHTKPLGDVSFAYITIENDTKNTAYGKIKSTFHGTNFMGKSLIVDRAKPDFHARWEMDQKKEDSKAADRAKRERIRERREQRIQEANQLYPCNSITGHLISTTASIAAQRDAYGYQKSAHTFANLSGNTKAKPPVRSLRGEDSYGSLTRPKSKTIHSQHFGRTSGRGTVVQGRYREKARSVKDMKASTLRINVNGNIRLIKCYQTKVWGYATHKKPRDLVAKFVRGEWKDGNDHIVETLSKNVIVFNEQGSIEVVASVDKFAGEEAKQDLANSEVEEEEENDEQAKARHVLASLLNNFDFDKPMVVNEARDEEYGHSDYEYNGASDSENERTDVMEVNLDAITQFKSSHQEPKGLVPYGEDDEGNELDGIPRYTTEGFSRQYDAEHGIASEANVVLMDEVTEDVRAEITEDVREEATEDEFIPTFGGAPDTETNVTENLRSLFNPAQSSEFKLINESDNEDIDTTKSVTEDKELKAQIQAQIQESLSKLTTTRASNGLFFTHFNSPFLVAQTQISKVGAGAMEMVDDAARVGTIENYDAWFWEQRKEITRECKRRRRDVLRQMNKKRSK